ncbi:MAG TPA: GNAT family N-acetyltransferase, partial [Candidatus Acidoferrales bacterium]|nr:GNAT family N-acetyltransferase [Candidatus Acidoferrales bacterium]
MRAMERRDVDAVVAIQSTSPEIAQWTVADYDLAHRPSTFGWVAEDGERIGGFLVAREVVDEIEILNIAVLPKLRRQGIGSELLSKALKEASVRGAMHAYLEVRASNSPAIEFYKRHDFSVLDRRVRYYA